MLPGLGSAPLQPGTWHDLNLTTLGGSASGSCDGHVLFRDQPIRTIDTGFAALTTNGYFQVDFDDVRVEAVGPDWDPDPAPPAGCPAPPFDAPALVGAQLYTRGCQSNDIQQLRSSSRLASCMSTMLIGNLSVISLETMKLFP